MSEINPTFKETLEQRTFRQNYLKAINKAYKYDESIGIMDIGEDKKTSLQDIYIPLKFSKNDYNEDNLIHQNELYDILDLFKSNKHIIISGKPGSGKTTLSRSIINNLSSDDLTKMSSTLGRRLPLYFKLRDYKIDEINSYDDFFQQFIESMGNVLKIPLSREYLEFFLTQGWCFLLFDGVDEVGSKKNRLKIRNFILKHFNKYNDQNFILVTSRPAGIEDAYFHSYTDEEFKKIFKKNLLDFKFNLNTEQDIDIDTEQDADIDTEQDADIDTEQDADIDTEQDADIDTEQDADTEPSLLQLYYVAPFNDEQISDFSKKWFLLREENPQTATEKAIDFILSIEKIKNLSTLKRRPVFLSMMIHIHTTKGKLPYSRAKAYQYMVEAYIEHIDIARRLSKLHSKKWSFEDKERVLEELAYRLHSSNIQGNKDANEDASAQIILNKAELEKTIKAIIEENLEKWQEIESGDEKELLEFYLSRTGLLHEPEENKIQFSHLSFQEYLTAHRIYRKVIENPFQIESTIEKEIINRLDEKNQTKWNEVILLFFSLYKDATQTILNAFKFKQKENIYFNNLIMKLIESSEYGIKESDVKTWFETILDFTFSYVQRDNNNFNLKNFELIVNLFNNNRFDKNEIISYVQDKFVTLLDSNNIDELEKLLYFVSYDQFIASEFHELIVSNIEDLVTHESLHLSLDILSEDYPEISSYILKNLSLQQVLSYYETISPSSKKEFLKPKKVTWKHLLMHYDWIIMNLYGYIQLHRIQKKHSMQSTIDSYLQLRKYKRNAINNNWTKYWYSNMWSGHRNGFKKQLKNDILFGRFDYYLNQEKSSIQNNFVSLKIKELYKKVAQYLKKGRKVDQVLSSIFVLSETTHLVSTEYSIDLSVPWKTYDDFKKFSKIFKNYDELHRFFEDKLSEKIDKDHFINEMNVNMNLEYSIEKIIDKILKNEKFYTIYSNQDVVNIIAETI